MRRIPFHILLWVLIFCLLPLFGLSVPGPKNKGRLLAVYKASEGTSPKQNEIRWHLHEMLVAQGYSVDYQDVDSGLPGPDKMKAYRGVISWHRGPQFKDPSAYIRWMRDQVLSGRKVLVFGNFGAYTADQKVWATNEQLDEFYKPFGLRYLSGFTADPHLLEVVEASTLVTRPRKPAYYLHFASANPRNESDLVLRRKDLPNSESQMVVRTPSGGMVAESYLYEQSGGKIRWLVNREKFLADVLSAPVVAATGGRLLALYKGSERIGADLTTADNNLIARFLRPTLSESGYSLDFHDIEKGLPPEALVAQYSGILSWYQTASMESAAAYCEWLLKQIQAGRKVVVIGNLGAFQELDKQSNPPTARWLLPVEYNTFMSPFGLEFRGMWTNDPKILKVKQQEASMVPWVEKEHLKHYYQLRSTQPENKSYLVVERSDVNDSQSSFVTRTPFGGFALEGYLFSDVTGRGEYKYHTKLDKFVLDCLTFRSPTATAQGWTYQVKPSSLNEAPAVDQLPKPVSIPEATLVKRRVLAFYQRELGEASEKNRIQEVVESILNHLGLIVDYRAIEDGLPSEAEMAPYRGVLTWFAGHGLRDAQAYGIWLKSQLDHGRLAVVLGDYGAFQDRGFKTQVDAGPTLRALGVEFVAAPRRVQVTTDNLAGQRAREVELADPSVMGFERKLNLDDPDIKKAAWPVYQSVDPANKVYVRVADDRGKSDVVVVTRRGGLAVGEFLLFTPPGQRVQRESQETKPEEGAGPAAEENALPQWRLNPWRFFGEAFQVDGLPVMDPTTLNGRRIYFSHIDGDASAGVSLIDKSSLNAEIMYRDILAASNLPTTVSFVTLDLERKISPTYHREIDIGKKIMRLWNVEAATHTHTHPFNWRSGDLVRVESPDGLRLENRLPDYRKEVQYSVDFINQVLLPPGKTVKSLLWSGLCNPPEEVLGLTNQMGVLNMNGGDPIYDSVNPFVAGVAPLYQKVGQRYQFHTSAAGDFYYTNSWTRNYDGMKRLVEFFQYTEEPRRLRAMNLYYHFYLAERQLGIDGLRAAMSYVLSQKPAPMFVSNYVKIVQDVIVTQIGSSGPSTHEIHNTGACRTVRYDRPSQLPDMTKSAGLLGYMKQGDRLYVHLDDSLRHRIVLSSSPGRVPMLEWATHYVDDFKLSPKGKAGFKMRGSGPAGFSLVNLPPGAARVQVLGPKGEVANQSLAVDSSGRLTWEGVFQDYEGSYVVRVER